MTHDNYCPRYINIIISYTCWLYKPQILSNDCYWFIFNAILIWNYYQKHWNLTFVQASIMPRDSAVNQIILVVIIISMLTIKIIIIVKGIVKITIIIIVTCCHNHHAYHHCQSDCPAWFCSEPDNPGKVDFIWILIIVTVLNMIILDIIRSSSSWFILQHFIQICIESIAKMMKKEYLDPAQWLSWDILLLGT